MRPLIGITPSIKQDETSYIIHRAHCQAIYNAGGMPVILPYGFDEEVTLYAEQLAGLYLTGGFDIDPHYFQQEPHSHLGIVDPLRDAFEIALTREMVQQKKPLFGICRGSQVINVALGGTMYQDIATQTKNRIIQHRQHRPLHYTSHFIHIEKDSLLYDIVKQQSIRVNSNHHQANHLLGDELRTVATSEDGVIEAVERTEAPFTLGVQWHPEQLIHNPDRVSRSMYAYFINEAKKNK